MGDDGFYVETWALRAYQDQVDRAEAASTVIHDYTSARIVGHDEVGGLISLFMGPHDQHAAERCSDYSALTGVLRSTANALGANADRYDEEESGLRSAVRDVADEVAETPGGRNPR